MEITTTEQDKEKRRKRIEDSLRDSGTILNARTFTLQEFQKEKRKKRDRENI